MAEWRTVHRVGQKVLNDGGKANSLSVKVISFRTLSTFWRKLDELNKVENELHGLFLINSCNSGNNCNCQDNKCFFAVYTGYAQVCNIINVLQEAKKFYLKNKKDLGMACHTPPLKKVKKQGGMPLPSLGPIPLQKCRI